MNNLIKDHTEGALEIAQEKAKEWQEDSLQECLTRLENHTVKGRKVFLYKDFAPLSFYFEVIDADRQILNGGIIYHGSHDRGGDGGAPTFSVNLTPTQGWAIHT